MTLITATPSTRTTRQPAPSTALRNRLQAAGLDDVNSVVMNRRTGRFTVKFVAKNASSPYCRGTKTGREWAAEIAAVVPEADILEADHVVMEWRATKPVWIATVVLALPQRNQKSA